ncbi:hypothetical protein BDQ12DRAFT_687735 [Crucibulum laeve]|uniref:Transcription factor TFIIIC triple barrel domain-containing protein n=1 Tax=Crucibulum laeve TaxID=68775 RepID=A0A5C3LS09_9AGAR|nr:hypothetical protein BDQ12DRAFT_687735 [Crucibulum laeve]
MTSAPSSLCPGYKQVEAFGPDEDYEDEEVSYVTLDLGSIEPTLVPSSSTYRLIGLDTPTPFLQLSGTILRGRHDSLLGTELLFTEDKETHDWSKRSIVHVANTEQRVCFTEVRLQPKVAVEDENSMEGIEEAPTAPAEDKIDRMTGKAPLPTRAPRTRKDGTTKEKTKKPPKEKVAKEPKEKRATRASTRTKGKGKAKAVDEDEDYMDLPYDEDSMDVMEDD